MFSIYTPEFTLPDGGVVAWLIAIDAALKLAIQQRSRWERGRKLDHNLKIVDDKLSKKIYFNQFFTIQ